jgi:hypothetical protein
MWKGCRNLRRARSRLGTGWKRRSRERRGRAAGRKNWTDAFLRKELGRRSSRFLDRFIRWRSRE